VDDDLGANQPGWWRDGVGFERSWPRLHRQGRRGWLAAREVSRFARKQRMGNKLIEMCRVVGHVCSTEDGIRAATGQ